MLGHPNLKNILVFTRGVEGVPKKCGKQEFCCPKLGSAMSGYPALVFIFYKFDE